MKSIYKTISYNLKIKDENMREFLKFMCHIAKNVYNDAMVILHNQYRTYGRIPSAYNLNKINSLYINSKVLNAYVAKSIDNEAYNAMSKYVKNPKATRCPKLLSEDELFPLIIEHKNVLASCKKRGKIKFPVSSLITSNELENVRLKEKIIREYKDVEVKVERFEINIPKEVKDKNIKRVNIVPRFDGRFFIVNITYLEGKENQEIVSQNRKGTLAIDLGINNFATCVNSNNNESFIVDGKYLKSRLQWFNKQIAYYSSHLEKDQKITCRIASLYMHKNWTIKTYVNRASRTIINYAIKHNIKTIVVGWTYFYKDKKFKLKTQDDHKRVIQLFKQFPLAELKERIRFMCVDNGINYNEVDEKYTSKCSFYDGEEVGFHYEYLGKRIKRGLYKTKNGILVNSDVNAALNILKVSKTEDDETIHRLMNSGVTVPLRIRE